MQPTRERLQALKLNPVCHRVQLTELVREELAELAPLAMEKGEELVLEDDEDCWVETEPDSAGHCPAAPGDQRPQLFPAGKRSKSGDRYPLSERTRPGPGIEEAEIERLSERFYSRGNANGAGLGLAIVEMIASKIGCRLALHNREQGSLCARLVFDISEPANRVLIEVARGEVKAS